MAKNNEVIIAEDYEDMKNLKLFII